VLSPRHSRSQLSQLSLAIILREASWRGGGGRLPALAVRVRATGALSSADTIRRAAFVGVDWSLDLSVSGLRWDQIGIAGS